MMGGGVCLVSYFILILMIEREFDLDELFTLNYSFDKLKDVLAYLLSKSKQTAARLSTLEKEALAPSDATVREFKHQVQ